MQLEEHTAKPWLAQWEEVREIARGGQGVVSEVRHRTRTSKRAVVKEIVERWREDEQAHERLRHEATMMSYLHESGARVPEVYDSFMQHSRRDPDPFILMEFIEGTRFDEWLHDQAPTNAAEAARITLAVAETIAVCHDCKVGHRDLKPANMIFKDGNIGLPFVLDFGISFDSRQTVALTREGEMFWNEFILLPECQDLAGGHRDLRSDVTALVGLFFTCITGEFPRVLRDARDRAPHQRHQDLIVRAASTPEEGEQLLWLFQRGFAQRLDDRFQALDEFTRELQRIADPSSAEDLNVIEQFTLLDKVLRATDRNVQLAALKQVLDGIEASIDDKLKKQLRGIQQANGSYHSAKLGLDQLSDLAKPLPSGELLDKRALTAHVVTRPHFQLAAVALLLAVAIDLETQFFVCSFAAEAKQPDQPLEEVAWSKVAVLEAETGPTQAKIDVIVRAVKAALARELAKLARGSS